MIQDRIAIGAGCLLMLLAGCRAAYPSQPGPPQGGMDSPREGAPSDPDETSDSGFDFGATSSAPAVDADDPSEEPAEYHESMVADPGSFSDGYGVGSDDATAGLGSAAPPPTGSRRGGRAAGYGGGRKAKKDGHSPRRVPSAPEAVRPDAEKLHRERDRMESKKPKPPSLRRDSPTPVVRAREIAAPAIRAGRHDDNKQYNRFLSFLLENRHYVKYPVDVSERLLIRVTDKNDASLHNCRVDVKSLAGKTLATSLTYADGTTQFFPADAARSSDKDFSVVVRCGGETRTGQLGRGGRRKTGIRFKSARKLPARVPVDIAIVLDTTGSMQSQIDRLKKTLKAIHFQLTQLPTKPDIRFALVAYRDRGDDYVTQPHRFTNDVGQFQSILDRLDADGGGDTPEDLQSGLDDAMHKLNWRKNALRLGFIVADAIPHTDYQQKFNYREAMRESLGRGIKWVSVGAGGLGRDGEVIFRQIAQFTMGEYVFITQGGAGDHEGGVGEASHHVGSNYKTENLDQAIVRIVRRELSYLTDKPKDFDDTIVATAKPGVPRDTVMKPAVEELMRQLADYSSMQIEKGTALAIVPTTVSDEGVKDVGEYLTQQMELTASRSPSFKVLSRDLKALSQELKLQLSDLFNPKETVAIGEMIGAELLIVSKLTLRKDGASLFAKLIRVQTGEVLSVAQVDMSGTVLKSS